MKILVSGEYNSFKEGFNGQGIYMVSGLFESQTFERPIYIGSSDNLKRRIHSRHIPELETNDHCNKPLQNAWNKYGKENFIWFLLEACDKENLLLREQYYFGLYEPFADELKGFNISKDALSSRRGYKVTQETKDKIRATRQANPKLMQECQNWGKSRAKEIILVDPQGKSVKVKGIRKFCKEQGLRRITLYKLIKKEISTYKGWTFPNEYRTKIS